MKNQKRVIQPIGMFEMDMIARDMKVIAELPSEKPKDVSSLVKVEYPEEGGIITYLSDHPYPYRGFPFYEFVDKIDALKKVGRATVSGMYHNLKSVNKLWFITLLPGLWIGKILVHAAIYAAHRFVVRSLVKPEMYSTAIRELHRVFSTKFSEYEDQQTAGLRTQIGTLMCSILEFDNAYRYRFQDVIVELNKDALKKNPIKELMHLCDVASSREQTQDVRDTWTLGKLALKFYLRFDRRLKTILIDALLNLDFGKVALTIEDKHFASFRKDYKCRFVTDPQTNEDKMLMENVALYQAKEDAKKQIRDESTRIHEEMFVRFKSELEKVGKPDSSKKENVDEERMKLTEEYRASIEDVGRKFQEKDQILIGKVLTKEQLVLAEKQAKENLELDKLYNEKLEQVENDYWKNREKLVQMYGSN